ncbi:MAG: hypothetical protein WKG07_49785 [Hymenobacter sp.]
MAAGPLAPITPPARLRAAGGRWKWWRTSPTIWRAGRGVGLRVGSGALALVGRYRLSALLPSPALPEPPRLLLGLEIGWL